MGPYEEKKADQFSLLPSVPIMYDWKTLTGRDKTIAIEIVKLMYSELLLRFQNLNAIRNYKT